MTSIELLSPARDLACGKAAVDHGADAVYIGAPRFGARQSASNSVEDIAELCKYAHRFGVRVYVTLNTILYDDELHETERLAWELYRVGVDAFIVQDMSLLRLNMPPVPLHGSTQMDNRTVDKAQWLNRHGISQIVLARELTLHEISAIHRAVPNVIIEAFVHGALCVSYSGRCYASQFCFQRSANRGACAQFCRLPFTLIDAEGREIMREKHPLSLRDMNRSEQLEVMMNAGVRSFKIEGRLKDEAYVKNVTAYYRQAIDSILSRRKEFVRASYGTSSFTFKPDLNNSFSRGYTDYFLHGRTPNLASMDTPKSRGPEVGFVKEIRGGCIIVAGSSCFNNGDGLCYMDADGHMKGFRVNRAEGNHLYPAKMPTVRKGDTLWRSYNQQWESVMSGISATRLMHVRWVLEECEVGFLLSAVREDGVVIKQTFESEHVLARTSQEESIRSVLSKLGDTCYQAKEVEIRFTQPWFVPRSLLAEWRRTVLAQFVQPDRIKETKVFTVQTHDDAINQTCSDIECINVSNAEARKFYEHEGFSEIPEAIETRTKIAEEGQTLMTCRYCLRYELGWCPTHQGARSPYREPYYLVSRDGRRFRLKFDCQACQMKVVTT